MVTGSLPLQEKMSLTPKIFYYSLHQPLTQVLPFSRSQLSHWRNESPELDQLRLVTFLSYIRPPSITMKRSMKSMDLVTRKTHIHKFL